MNPSWTLVQPCFAQDLAAQANPVYLDESPLATEGLSRISEHVRAGNLDEAVRVAQSLLDDLGDRVVPSVTDPDVFLSVRARVHALLTGDPELLKRYRQAIQPRAEELLKQDDLVRLEKSFLYSRPGFEAALRLTQRELENAHFHAADQFLSQLEDHPDRINTESPAQAQLGIHAYQLAAELARYLPTKPVTERSRRWGVQISAPQDAHPPIAWPASASFTSMSAFDPLPASVVAGGPKNDPLSTPLWSVPIDPASKRNDAAMGLGRFGQGRMGMGGMGGGNFQGAGGTAATVPPQARELLVLPAASGEMVYVANGTSITALDRFTLSERWRVVPGVADAPRLDSGITGDRIMRERNFANWREGSDELSCVSVHPRALIVSTGRGGTGIAGEGDDRLHAIDPATGEVRWTVQPGAMEATLAESTVRGPARIEEDTVVVAGRKNLPDRRLIGLVLGGLDLRTGELKWARSIASAGSMPWVMQSLGTEGLTVEEGMIYRADRLGVICAVEAASGRVRWIRRMPVITSMASEPVPGWQLSTPVVDGSSIIVLSPDLQRLLRLDARTGAIVSERPMSDLTPTAPRYFMVVGLENDKTKSLLVGVGDDRVCAMDLSTFETSQVIHSEQVPMPGIRGRVVIAGQELMIPTSTGYRLVSAQRPDQGRIVRLEQTGQVLPLNSQLVVVDDQQVHSYLRWEVAQAYLDERMGKTPGDLVPPLTMVELAYRAGHPERLVDSVEKSQAALKLTAAAEVREAGRVRLVEALQHMLVVSLEPALVTAQPPSPATVEATTPASSRAGQSPVLTDRAILQKLVDALGLEAKESAEKVAFAFARGRLLEMGGASPQQLAQAVAAYQEVIADPALAQANWQGQSVSVRGGLEATRRMQMLVSKLGPDGYAPQEAQLKDAIARLGEHPTAQQLDDLIQRYPLARDVVRLSVRSAQLSMGVGESGSQLAEAALMTGLRLGTMHPAPIQSDLGELAGVLVQRLSARGQISQAISILRGVRERYPGLALTSVGVPIDVAILDDQLSKGLLGQMRWPSIGSVQDSGTQAILGWTLLSPLLSDRQPSRSDLLVLASEEEVGIWARSSAGEVAPAAPSEKPAEPQGAPLTSSQQMAKLWARPVGEGGKGYLIRQMTDRACFLFTKDGDGFIECMEAKPNAKAERVFKSEVLSKLFSRDDTRGFNRVPGVVAGEDIDTPDGSAAATSLLVTMDQQTLVLVQRSGKAVGLDAQTGKKLWSVSTGVQRVYDVDLLDGVLVVGGDQEERGAVGGVGGPLDTITGLRPAIQIIDARTGKLTQSIVESSLRDPGKHNPAWGRIRSVRVFASGAGAAGSPVSGSALGAPGSIIAATNSGVQAIDILSGQTNWSITIEPLSPLTAMWLIHDDLVMLSPDRSLWLCSASTGQLRSAPLDMPQSHLNLTQSVDVFPLGPFADSGFGVSTQQGYAVFAAGGEIKGADAMEGQSTMLRPIPAQGRVVSIETVSQGRSADGLMIFSLKSMELGSAMMLDSKSLLLGARPNSMQLMDGRIAITAGSVTVIVPAPGN